MSWSRVGSAVGSTSYNATHTATLPSGYASGDLLLLFVRGYSESQYISAGPSGWTTLYSTTGTLSSSYWAVFGKIAGSGSETAPQTTFGGTSAKTAITVAYRDSNGVMSLGSIVGDPDFLQNAGLIDYPACTVAEDNATVLLWCTTGKNNDAGNYAADAPSTGTFTELVESEIVDTYGVFGVLNEWIQTTATNVSSGTVNITGDTALSGRLGVIFYLKANAPSTTKYLKLRAHSSAASATGIEGVVLNAARDTVIGEFSGKAFEAVLESGDAVLVVPVADIIPDGTTLTTTDTPLVAAYNSTEGTVGLGSATVIEV